MPRARGRTPIPFFLCIETNPNTMAMILVGNAIKQPQVHTKAAIKLPIMETTAIKLPKIASGHPCIELSALIDVATVGVEASVFLACKPSAE